MQYWQTSLTAYNLVQNGNNIENPITVGVKQSGPDFKEAQNEKNYKNRSCGGIAGDVVWRICHSS